MTRPHENRFWAAFFFPFHSRLKNVHIHWSTSTSDDKRKYGAWLEFKELRNSAYVHHRSPDEEILCEISPSFHSSHCFWINNDHISAIFHVCGWAITGTQWENGRMRDSLYITQEKLKMSNHEQRVQRSTQQCMHDIRTNNSKYPLPVNGIQLYEMSLHRMKHNLMTENWETRNDSS